jgi:hypothetical protein
LGHQNRKERRAKWGEMVSLHCGNFERRMSLEGQNQLWRGNPLPDSGHRYSGGRCDDH